MFPKEIHSLFHFSNKNQGLLLTKPKSAYLYYIDRRVNLLTGESKPFDISKLIQDFENYKIAEEKEDPEVFHFCYELGHLICSGLEVNRNEPLAIHLKYQESKWINYSKTKTRKLNLSVKDGLESKDYDLQFSKVMNHLLDGDCYQVNLTHTHQWLLKDSIKPEEVLSGFYSSPNLSEYAHHSYIPKLEKMILSNSPECLFQIYQRDNGLEIHSTPIKGTLKGESKEKAKELFNSQKNIAELNMITDLIRNDLAKIETPRVKVLNKRKLLKVPGLWHLYSRVAVKTSKAVTLKKLLWALFPGGSITGAPKRRVMQIISGTEHGPRGHYCGSTFLNFKGLKTASINIRTLEIDFKNQSLSLGAGGGITLKSQSKDEYLEMFSKQESLLKVLQITSC